MNSAVLSALVIMATVAVTVYSSPCTDLCNGTCGTAKAACDLTGFLGDLCNVNFGVCSQMCGAVCNCVDTCGAQCGGELATCRGDGTDLLKLLPCNVQFGNCQLMCNTQCGISTTAGVFSQLTGQTPT